MRAHNRFLSQMRATFRALEMSPDLARTSNSPINMNNAEVSRNIMESLQQPTSAQIESSASAATPSLEMPTTANALPATLASIAASITPTAALATTTASMLNNTRGELRAFSQRLEHELRARRESFGNRLSFGFNVFGN